MAKIKTIKEVRANYWQYLATVRPELAKMKRTRLSQNDYCTDIRVIFTDYVNHLLVSGDISEKLAQRVTL